MTKSKLEIWERVRTAPQEALTPISGGRLKGKSDINPVWRLKTLTEQFGPCGIGWYYDILKQWLEPGANGEIAAFININLFYKADEEWSKPVFGTGGAAFVAKESGGLYVSDECWKMALTDALSVSCKALGVAADVYWSKDTTKFTGKSDTTLKTTQEPPKQDPAKVDSSSVALTPEQRKKAIDYILSLVYPGKTSTEWGSPNGYYYEPYAKALKAGSFKLITDAPDKLLIDLSKSFAHMLKGQS